MFLVCDEDDSRASVFLLTLWGIRQTNRRSRVYEAEVLQNLKSGFLLSQNSIYLPLTLSYECPSYLTAF